MRNAYIVSYDVADAKRLRRVFKTMLGMGDHLQLSVFRCELSERDKMRLVAKLDAVIHHDEDQILIIDIGPAPGRSRRAVAAIGLPYAPRTRKPVVV